MSSIVLNYHDYVIRESDVHALMNNEWINDTIIGFYLQYLEQQVFCNEKRFLFISPEVVQCIKTSTSSEAELFLDPLEAKDFSVVFFPINNNEDTLSPGGSHWSLLAFQSKEKKFYHWDSCRSINYSASRMLVSKLTAYFDVENASLVEMESLQQENTYDCGIHVLCTVDNITKHFLAHNNLQELVVIHNSEVKGKRKKVYELIKSLANK